jgi:hypothetical protein
MRWTPLITAFIVTLIINYLAKIGLWQGIQWYFYIGIAIVFAIIFTIVWNKCK